MNEQTKTKELIACAVAKGFDRIERDHATRKAIEAIEVSGDGDAHQRISELMESLEYVTIGTLDDLVGQVRNTITSMQWIGTPSMIPNVRHVSSLTMGTLSDGREELREIITTCAMLDRMFAYAEDHAKGVLNAEG